MAALAAAGLAGCEEEPAAAPPDTVDDPPPPPTSRGMVLVPAGTFTMGDGVSSCGTDTRRISLSRDFELGRYAVTNAE